METNYDHLREGDEFCFVSDRTKQGPSCDVYVALPNGWYGDSWGVSGTAEPGEMVLRLSRDRTELVAEAMEQERYNASVEQGEER